MRISVVLSHVKGLRGLDQMIGIVSLYRSFSAVFAQQKIRPPQERKFIPEIVVSDERILFPIPAFTPHGDARLKQQVVVIIRYESGTLF